MTNGQVNQDPQPLTRMRIPHILLWMCASAVLLTAMRQVHHYYVGQFDSGAEQYHRYLGVMFAFAAVSGGAGLLAVVLGVQRRRQGERAFTAPGHWVVLLMLLSAINYAVLFPASIWLQLRNLIFAPGVLEGFIQLPAIVLAVVAWKKCTLLIFWRGFFLLQVLSGVAGCVMSLGVVPLMPYSVVSMVLNGLTAVVFFVAVGGDFVTRRFWDWLHWIGVVLLMSSFAMSFVKILFV